MIKDDKYYDKLYEKCINYCDGLMSNKENDYKIFDKSFKLEQSTIDYINDNKKDLNDFKLYSIIHEDILTNNLTEYESIQFSSLYDLVDYLYEECDKLFKIDNEDTDEVKSWIEDHAFSKGFVTLDIENILEYNNIDLNVKNENYTIWKIE